MNIKFICIYHQPKAETVRMMSRMPNTKLTTLIIRFRGARPLQGGYFRIIHVYSHTMQYKQEFDRTD